MKFKFVTLFLFALFLGGCTKTNMWAVKHFGPRTKPGAYCANCPCVDKHGAQLPKPCQKVR